MRNAAAVSSVPPLLLITTMPQRSPRLSSSRTRSKQRVVVDVVALEVHPRPAAPHRRRDLVVVLVAARLQQRPGAHVRAADAQHDDAIDLAGQPIGRRLELASSLAAPLSRSSASSRSGISRKPASSGSLSGGTLPPRRPKRGVGQHLGPGRVQLAARAPSNRRAGCRRASKTRRSDRKKSASSDGSNHA